MTPPNDVIKILDRIKLWQLLFVGSAACLIAGLTGSFYDYQLIEGSEQLAIGIGLGGIILSVILRTFPPGTERAQGYHNVSPLQLGFASQFKEWTTFEDAEKVHTPDHDLTPSEQLEKLNQLRIELASYQGLLDREIRSDGLHYIKYK